MKRRVIVSVFLIAWPVGADDAAIPPPVSAANYTDLLERPPFRRYLSLSESLVLSGVATLPEGKVVTVWNRTTGESFIVTATPNPQGWKLIDLAGGTDLRSVAATISAGDQKITLRFDPERLTPPKLDNTSKPARRGESTIVVEALLRSLDPAAARSFEALPAAPQEAFRKSFAGFLAAYPTASDAKRLAFVRHALEDTTEAEAGAEAGTDSSARPAAAAPATPAAPAPAPPAPPQSAKAPQPAAPVVPAPDKK